MKRKGPKHVNCKDACFPKRCTPRQSSFQAQRLTVLSLWAEANCIYGRAGIFWSGSTSRQRQARLVRLVGEQQRSWSTALGLARLQQCFTNPQTTPTFSSCDPLPVILRPSGCEQDFFLAAEYYGEGEL